MTEQQRIITAIGGALAVAACMSPATRISEGLQRYGLDQTRSDCVGRQLQGDLSLSQMRQLGRAAAAYRKDDAQAGMLTVGDLVRVGAQIQDPAILPALGKATAGCRVLL